MPNVNFLDIQFPTDVSMMSSGGLEFYTTINTNRYKSEFRNINWQHPRRKYNINYNLKSKKQIDTLLAFFNLCKGKAISFRYKDWLDYSVEKSPIGIGDNANNTFYLRKVYSFSGQTASRVITKPISDTVKVSVDDVEIPFSDFAIGKNTGLVQLSKPPTQGSVVTASFKFDTHVRFENDLLSIKQEGKSNYNAENLTLIEISE
ncbi:MAG: DUF2460 domain-containing protein [Alphaproteobacteria bacterium]|nr:DUF2460 domain-containing protein [Rickettsiales bacterium]